MTPNMRAFIEKNSVHKIVSGGHVTDKGKPIKTMGDSAGVEYSFSDGEKLIMWKEDAKSAPDFSPIWDLG
jgi:hypothetical protein